MINLTHYVSFTEFQTLHTLAANRRRTDDAGFVFYCTEADGPGYPSTFGRRGLFHQYNYWQYDLPDYSGARACGADWSASAGRISWECAGDFFSTRQRSRLQHLCFLGIVVSASGLYRHSARDIGGWLLSDA